MKEIGKVINIVSSKFFVEIKSNKIIECTSRGIFKTKELKPVVGDNVLIEVENNIGNIIEVIDRKKYIKRPKMANLTRLILVVSVNNPTPDFLMLDKQLAFAEYNEVEPLIIINKKDLDRKEADRIKKIYSNIGYKVIETNAREKDGIRELKKILHGNISAFSGNSGVGKSTLINSIFNEKKTEEGDISFKNKKGKNTTTSVELYKIEDETYIADTPGFSNFDIHEISYKDLYKYFKEFNEYIEFCEYQDCTHIKEENCGIKKAIENDKIFKIRYENYIKIYNELKDKEEHKW